MTIENNLMQIKCNIKGCGSLAKFSIIFGERKNEKVLLCANCMRILYDKLGKRLIPKSPNNMLNKQQ